MKKSTSTALAVAGAGVVLLVACQEMVPTATDASLIPIEPVTVEVVLDFEDFVEDVQVIGGFGSPSGLGRGLVAHDFKGDFDSRTLVRFGSLLSSISVADSTGVTRTDTAFTAIGGRIVIIFDSTEAAPDAPMTLTAAATTTPWHRESASWDLAIDTMGNRVPWPTPGAGSSTPIGASVLDRAVSDSVVIAIDSATIAAWRDTTNLARGAMIDVEEVGSRLDFTTVALRVDVVPSINLDTVVVLSAQSSQRTFIFHPPPNPEAPGLRVGGVPAWRSILRLAMPTTLTGPPELCALVGCPLAITVERLNQAELVLTTSIDDAAFAPVNNVLVDIRPVLVPELLPKSPLGASVVGVFGQSVEPELFDDQVGTAVRFPLSAFLMDLISGVTASGEPAPNTIAVMTTFEPLSVGFGSFEGPGGPGAPKIRLILTVSDNLQIP